MKSIHLLYFNFLLCLPFITNAQETLPAFSVTAKNKNITIQWQKPNELLTLLVIQKSLDSLNGFKSVASMPDPNKEKGSFKEESNNANHFYYRIFYVGVNGKYYFTQSQKAILEKTFQAPPQKSISPISAKIVITPPPKPINKIIEKKPAPEIVFEPVESIPKKEMIRIQKLTYKSFPILHININFNLLPVPWESTLRTNPFLYVNKESNLVLILPPIQKKNFQLKVWREGGEVLFHIKNIKEPQLLFDKSNFIYSGWFKYEIIENETLREKGRFLIQPD